MKGAASILLSMLIVVSVGPRAAYAQAEPWVAAAGPPQYFAVIVEDIDRAADWYGQVFGLDVLDRWEADDGSAAIVNLSSAALFVELIRDDRAEPEERARGFRKVGFGVSDVRKVADRVEAATGVRPRVSEFPQHGVRLVQLRDPEGNVVQLASRLSATGEPRTGPSARGELDE